MSAAYGPLLTAIDRYIAARKKLTHSRSGRARSYAVDQAVSAWHAVLTARGAMASASSASVKKSGGAS